MESKVNVVVPLDIFNAQSDHDQPSFGITALIKTLLFVKEEVLSDSRSWSAPTGVVFSVRPLISTVGVTAVGLPAPSNPITWVVVPVRYVSTPVPSVMIALFAVNPVLVPHTTSSLVLERVLIDVVLPDMRPESVSSADLIAPDIDPRVNI